MLIRWATLERNARGGSKKALHNTPYYAVQYVYSLSEIGFLVIKNIVLRVKARRLLALFDGNVGDEHAAAFDTSSNEIDDAKLNLKLNWFSCKWSRNLTFT